MIAEITKILPTPSKFGGSFFYIFFRGDDGKSYKTHVAEFDNRGKPMRNFTKWKDVMGVGVKLRNLKIWKDTIIDADSDFVVESNVEAAKENIKQMRMALEKRDK